MYILQEERNRRYVQEFASLKVELTSSRIIFFCLFCEKKKGGNEKKRKTKRTEKGSISEVISSLGDSSDTRELKQPRRRRHQNPTNLHIWQWKTASLHALHVHFSSFDILKTFSFFLRREMTCFAVVWMTWAHNDKCSILCSYVPSAGSKLIPEQLEHIFQE